MIKYGMKLADERTSLYLLFRSCKKNKKSWAKHLKVKKGQSIMGLRSKIVKVKFDQFNNK